MVKRIALIVEYDGSAFFGWQRQMGDISVQQVLEEAVAVIAGHPVRVIAAGRTDTGVHALAQVVHFDTENERPITAWVRGVNSHLPATIVVRCAQQVPDSFHARFDAVERQYRYVLLSGSVRPALLSGKVGWTHYVLDVGLMQKAMNFLCGQHDYSSFRASECQAKSPVRTMYSAKLVQKNELFIFEFTADAFLYHMIRNIVGALVYVGSKKMTVEEFEQMVQARNRKYAPPTFMADGLYLTQVSYPEDCGFLASKQLPVWFWGTQ